MAKTSAGSDADDYVVDRVESPDDTAAETSSETAVDGSAAPRAKEGSRLGGRFGRRRKADDEAAESDVTTNADTSDEAAKKRKASGSGRGKAATPAKKSAALAGAARLARVVTVLGVIAALLAVVLVVQLVKGPGDGAARAEREDRKEAARSAAETSIARLFSFDYKTLDADFAAQRAQTTGDFTAEIEKVTNPAVRPLAAKEHVIVQAVSVAAAVVDDPGPDVQVIVLLNQAVTLDLLPAPRLDRNRVLASMRLVDGSWKVAGVKAL